MPKRTKKRPNPNPRSPQVSRPRALLRRWTVPPWVWLAVIYVISVYLHYKALRIEAEFPLLATDEAQYLTVGENLRLGQGFTTRGEFHAGLPPLYPIFVAFAHSWGPSERIFALQFSCLLICLAVFPAYGLARHISLNHAASYLLAASAAFLPHTLFAGMYMAETLNYPLFLMAFLIFACWLDQPSRPRALIAGTLLSAMLLTKVAALSFAAAVLATVLILSLAPSRENRPFARPSFSAVWVFTVVIATQLSWQAFKYAHNAAGLGMYGHVLGDTGLPHLSASLLGAYLGDFLLAPGLLVAVPLFLWFRENGHARFALSVLLGATLFFQITIHGILEAGLTGFLRERLFLYSLPIMAIFAVKGMEALNKGGYAAKVLFVLVPLVLLGLLALYTFPYNPVIDVPWVSSLGSDVWASAYHFTKRDAIWTAVPLILVAGVMIMVFLVRWRPMALAVFTLVFYSVVFASSAKKMENLSMMGRISAARIWTWLSSNHVKPADRLIICGNMAYYEERHRVTPIDHFFLEWHRRFDLSDIMLLQIEALGRYDVRIARYPDQIRTMMRRGDHLLSATRLADLDLVSYQYPYYLYPRNRSGANPRPLYTIDIPEELAYGWPLGSPPEQQAYKMLGQPENLPAGYYRATLDVTADKGARLIAEVVGRNSNKIAAHLEGSADDIRELEFSTRGDTPLQFRLGGPGLAHASFRGATVGFTRHYGDPLRFGADSGQFTRDPGLQTQARDEHLLLNCNFAAVNGEWSAPLYTVRKGDPIEFVGWVTLPHPAGGRLWVELSSADDRYYLPAERVQSDQFGPGSFRAAASTEPLAPGPYRFTVTQVHGRQQIACTEFWNLVITDGGRAASP